MPEKKSCGGWWFSSNVCSAQYSSKTGDTSSSWNRGAMPSKSLMGGRFLKRLCILLLGIWRYVFCRLICQRRGARQITSRLLSSVLRYSIQAICRKLIVARWARFLVRQTCKSGGWSTPEEVHGLLTAGPDLVQLNGRSKGSGLALPRRSGLRIGLVY